MGLQRGIDWNRTLVELRTERDALQTVRPEELKAIIGGRPAVAWRGVSGRSYVFAVFDTARADLADNHSSVVVAVSILRDVAAWIISVRAYPAGDERFKLWLAECVKRGADAIHQHRLAETDEERQAIMADLRPYVPQRP